MTTDPDEQPPRDTDVAQTHAPETPAPTNPVDDTPPSVPAPSPARGGATREYRARWAFTIIAAFLLALYLLILFQGGALAGPTGAAFLGGALAIAVNGFAAVGLGWGRDWARFAMTPILWITVVAGLIQVALAFASGTITIPIGATLAAWALFARPSAELGPLPTSSGSGTLLVIAALAAALLAFF